jgi:hypothetical protein
MPANGEQPAPGSALAEVKAAVEDLLGKIAAADLDDTDLFPYGITQIVVTVRSGDAEVSVEVAGPDKAHDHDVEDWEEDDLDDLFDDEEE